MRVLWLIGLLGLGCTGSALPAPAPRLVETTSSVVAGPGKVDSRALAHAAMLCFVGGVAHELLGGRDRCATVTEAIGADASSRLAVRAMEPTAVSAVLGKLDDARWAALVRRTVEASREATAARRKDADDAALAAHAALAALFAEKDPSSRVVALTLAADRLESVRGLPPRRKIAAATPTFRLVYQIEPPSEGAPGAWLGWVSAAAAAAGRPAPSTGSTHARAQAAFGGVVLGLALQLEAAGRDADGDMRALADAYARRLQAAVAEADAKAKAKLDAKAAADAAEKKVTP
jgi:hypothetical protein